MENFDPLYRAVANEQGIDDHQLSRMCGARQLQRLRQGAYIDPADLAGLYPEDRHRLHIVATARAMRSPAVISHVSAAVMHGLPVWNMDLTRAHFTRDRRSGGFTTRWLRVHAAPLEDRDIEIVDGLAVTSVARTVLDLARSQPFEQAVVSGDGALNRARVSPAELAAAVVEFRGRRGIPAAAKAIAFMDAASESAGESRSRVIMQRLELPAPQLQRVIRRRGRHLGRVDFCLAEHGVVGEFDGLAKYERGRRGEESSGEVVAREKLREDAIRQTGAVVVRWVWRELDTPWVIRARFRDAFAIARKLPSPDWDVPRGDDGYVPRPRG